MQWWLIILVLGKIALTTKLEMYLFARRLDKFMVGALSMPMLLRALINVFYIKLKILWPEWNL